MGSKPKIGRVRIGTSGWRYPSWRGRFYPAGWPQRSELAYIASCFETLEVNGTFYSMTRPEACEAWRSAVPPSFVFAIKGSRYISHMLKLKKFDAPLGNFFAQGILRLGAQLGPILWQLPASVPFDLDRARPFLEALPRDVAAAERRARRHDARTRGRCALRAPDGRQHVVRHAIEPRHPSWFEEPALRLLQELDITLCMADTAGKHPSSLARTGGVAYVRLHGSTVLYASQYTDAELATWSRRVRRLRDDGLDVYVYFDNDAKGHAPFDALRLERAVAGRRGPSALAPTISARRAGGAGLGQTRHRQYNL